ncbi:MAG: CHAT domain-containing protein, partial [Acidobacteriota bacterium]|nr:CHAT domain-containing protein [Acidobacteriota bacterium]
MAACDVLFAAHPEAKSSSKCYYDPGSSPKDKEAAARRLDELLQGHPASAWLHFYLGNVFWTEHPVEADWHYRVAAVLFHERKDAKAEFEARDSIRLLLEQTLRHPEAGLEAERLQQLAQQAADPHLKAQLKAQAELAEASQLWSLYQDLGRAYELAQHAKESLEPEPNGCTKDCLLTLAHICLELGHYGEAADAYRRMTALGDPWARASGEYGLFQVLIEKLAERPDDPVRARSVLPQAQKALKAAAMSHDGDLEVNLESTLGLLMKGPKARQHFEQCRKAARQPTYSEGRMRVCLEAEARRLAIDDPAAAARTLLELDKTGEERREPWQRTFALGSRMRVAWSVKPPREAARMRADVLDAIEELRSSQSTPEARAALLSTWTDDFYWLSGRLFEASLSDPGGQDFAGRAWAVIERLRARTLADILRGTPKAHRTPKSLAAEKEALEEAQKRTHARAQDWKLPVRERQFAADDARRLAQKEITLEREPAADETVTEVTLAQLRQRLASDEALLSFQVSPWRDWTGDFGGGSWLLAVTRDAAPRVYELPDRGWIRDHAARLSRLLEQPGPIPHHDCDLYKALLARPLRELPRGIRRLILIPDDHLHRVPFAVLRAVPEGEPLVARYQISVASSGALWYDGRARQPKLASRAALVLANPPQPTPEDREKLRRSGIYLPERLDKLPRARLEGEDIARLLGLDRVRLRTDKEVSKGDLLATDLSLYEAIHFATHTLIDDEQSDRSGIWLSPGAGDHGDGLLKVPEILQLDASDRLIVLSTCESASGQILRGEGVMSLARAFFGARAR